MQMTLAAVGRRQCGRSQTCNILLIYFFIRINDGRIPASANGPEAILLAFCHVFSVF